MTSIFKSLLGLGLFALFFSLFVVAPEINLVNYGLDVSTFDISVQTVIRLGFLGIAFAFLLWGVSDYAESR